MARLAISLSRYAPDPYKKWHMPSRFETYKSRGILRITLPYLHALKDESVIVYFIPKIWNLFFHDVNMFGVSGLTEWAASKKQERKG